MRVFVCIGLDTLVGRFGRLDDVSKRGSENI